MQGGLIHENNLSVRLPVRLSVRPPVKRVDSDELKETCAHILIPHERSFIPIVLILTRIMTLIGIIALICVISPNTIALQADYVLRQSS